MILLSDNADRASVLISGSTRLFVLAFLVGSLVPAFGQPETWDIVKIRGRDYLKGSQVAKYYDLEATREGSKVIFSGPRMQMEAVVDSDTAKINGTSFLLSFPFAESKGEVLVSRVDLCKLLHPVLKPEAIRGAQDFDTVVIDPGHGGRKPGSKGAHAFEKIYTLDLAKKLWKKLVLRGFTVQFTRLDDKFVSLPERVTRANKWERAIFVSLHFNSHSSDRPNGLETFAITPPGTPTSGENKSKPETWRGNLRDAESIALATAVHTSALETTRANDRGVRRARFHVLRGLDMPGILFEGGYISNLEEGENIDKDAYRDLLAHAIADGIETFHAALQRE
jgi:N-acetylmuramoyl-L-alanine amidase